MRRRLLLLLLIIVICAPLHSYRLLYREQLYRLYHQHLIQYPNRITENIYWLQRILRADFANPLYALATIEDQEEWRRYRALFNMHVNLNLTESYLQLGARYFKFNAYFFNAPWRRQNLESLEYARRYIKEARGYWSEAQRWSKEATQQPTIHLEEIQHWSDESWRIENSQLDYDAIIDRHLERLQRVVERFQSMDADSY